MDLASLRELGLPLANDVQHVLKQSYLIKPAQGESVPVVAAVAPAAAAAPGRAPKHQKSATTSPPQPQGRPGSEKADKRVDDRGSLGPAAIIPAGVPLPCAEPGSFSILCYNVLLPNSQDGWWIYKYYRNPDRSVAAWPMRQELLKRQLLGSDADIICVQEVSDKSFEEDFSFMVDAGYVAKLHEKGNRMRPATFFKSTRWELVTALHKDRTLTLALRLKDSTQRLAFVVNGHLAAGPSADRRMRQVQEALDAVAKECKRLGVPAGDMPVIVCGDFNSQGKTAVRELLVEGSVGPEFRESGDPTEKGQEGKQLTTKVRTQQVGSFRDAMEAGFAGSPPATILAANIDDKMQHEDGKLKEALIEAVRRAFQSLSTGVNGEGVPVMSKDDTWRWLERVNGEVGRGSEYRAALAAFERLGDECLTFEEFLGIYSEELAEGKFWGVEHDLSVLNGSGMSVVEEGPTELRFDYIYYTCGRLDLLSVQEPLTKDHKAQVYGPPWEVLPNSWHPSDHLPVAATFKFRA